MPIEGLIPWLLRHRQRRQKRERRKQKWKKIKQSLARRIGGLTISFVIVFGLFGVSWLGTIAILAIDVGIFVFNKIYDRALEYEATKT